MDVSTSLQVLGLHRLLSANPKEVQDCDPASQVEHDVQGVEVDVDVAVVAAVDGPQVWHLTQFTPLKIFRNNQLWST